MAFFVYAGEIFLCVTGVFAQSSTGGFTSADDPRLRTLIELETR
jgi:hypothetical protein